MMPSDTSVFRTFAVSCTATVSRAEGEKRRQACLIDDVAEGSEVANEHMGVRVAGPDVGKRLTGSAASVLAVSRNISPTK